MSDGTLKQEYSDLAARVGDKTLAVTKLQEQIDKDLERMDALLREIHEQENPL